MFLMSPGHSTEIGLQSARPAILAAGKGRGEWFLHFFIFVFLPCPSLLSPLLSLLSLLFVPRRFEEKRGDIVFGFPWCVMRGAWFHVCSRYLVSATPTVLDRSF